MQIKGLSVKSIPDFVKKNFPGRYQEWLQSLPEEAKQIFSGFIKVNEWYPIVAGLTVPLHTVGKVFYNNDWKKSAWEMGRFSAGEALTGIYQIYVRFGTPRHLIDRAGRVMSAFFSNSEIKLIESTKNSLLVHISRFESPDEAIEYNIAGWMQRALEISGVKNVKVDITKSLARKDFVTEFRINWE
jgi:uncharacterized protein (TIGR02265 family)